MIIKKEDYARTLQHLLEKQGAGEQFVVFPDDGDPLTVEQLLCFADPYDAQEFRHEMSTDVDSYHVMSIRSVCAAMAEAADNGIRPVERRDSSIDIAFMVAERSLLLEKERLINDKNKKAMRQENYDFLKTQVMITGFGEGLDNLLKSKMEKGEEAFTINHRLEYGNDKLDTTLHFSKSKDKDMYFFNKYDLGVKKGGEEQEMKQSFLVSPKHTTFTVKEAYNLMSGRAVNKDMAALQKVNDGDTTRYKPTGNRYNAWVELDFNDADKYGNFKQKIYSGADKLDVAKVLEGQPIKELQADDTKKWLIDSLHRGNRREVTFAEDGNEHKGFLQADPKNMAIKQFDPQGKELAPLKVVEAPKEQQAQGQEAGQAEGQKNGQQQTESGKQKQDDKPDRKKSENQGKRKGVRM